MYAWIQDVPINAEIYGRIRERLTHGNTDGLIAHLVYKRESGLRYVALWESREICERYFDEQVHPAVWSVFEQAGIPRPAEEPCREEVELVDVWIPTYDARPAEPPAA